MTIRFVSSSEARTEAWANAVPGAGPPLMDDLGLLHAMIRLAASRICPCTRELLAGAASAALRGLVPDEISAPTRVDGAIDDLVMSGDLMTGSLEPGSRRRLVFLGPPLFVRRASRAVFIMGGVAESTPAFNAITRYRGPFRELEPPPTDDQLGDEGFAPYPLDAWMESPPRRTAASLLAELDRLLDTTPPSGDVLEAEIIEPTSRSAYYVGRWTTPRRHTGRFIVRRKRRWGGRGWGYGELVEGSVTRYLAFPAVDARFRPCDEAWWAMCASDSVRGTPQALLVEGRNGATRIGFQMPMPMWVERRLLTLGSQSLEKPAGTLVAYDLPAAESPEEIAFLTERLWLTVRQVTS